MSLKHEIQTWVDALIWYDKKKLHKAYRMFYDIRETSKIQFNMGIICATLGQHGEAVDHFEEATKFDDYLGVAHFQKGVSNFLLGNFEDALKNFTSTIESFRGNIMIDYSQLGLLFKLYSCEALFNRAMCYIYLQQLDDGMRDLESALREMVVEEHRVIQEAIYDRGEGYTVFSIQDGFVFRPNEAKVRNLPSKDYLGRAQLIATSDAANTNTSFAGSEIKRAGGLGSSDDRPAEKIPWAGSNLVKPELQSRHHRRPSEGSGADTGRSNNVFPPTPPPDNDKFGGNGAGGSMSRAASVRGGPGAGPKPQLPRLNVETSRSRTRYEKASASPQDQRRGPHRSHSMSHSQPPPPQRGLSRRQTDRVRSRGSDDGFGDRFDEYRSRSSSRRRPVGGNTYYTFNRDSGGMVSSDFEIVEPPKEQIITIKVHAEDVRYILVPEKISYGKLVEHVIEKFGIRREFKMKIRDATDGDMVTLGDDADLNYVFKKAIDGRTEKGGEVKVDIWIQERTR